MSDEGQIKSIIERVQRLQEEKRTIEDDIKEVYAEARGNGYDVKVLRAVVKHLGKDLDEVAEFDAIFDLYLQSYHAADRPSRAHVARDAGARTREAAQRQNPPEGEVGSAVRAGAPVSQTTTPGSLTAAQSEAAAGSSPEQGADECTAGEGEAIPVQSAQFVTPSGEGEGAPPPVDLSPAAERPAFARKAYVLRPHCRKPDQCGSYGSKHCGECERLAKAAEEDDGADVPAFVRKTHDHIAMGEQA